MLNQIRRLWADNGSDDKDFSVDEVRLKQALMELKAAANQMSHAATVLLDFINGIKQ